MWATTRFRKVPNGARGKRSRRKGIRRACEKDEQLQKIEARCKELAELAKPGATAAQLDAHKTELAQLESQCKQLETRIDNIYTSELVKGKEAAREHRNSMRASLDVLFSLFEGVFADIQKARAVAPKERSPLPPWRARPRQKDKRRVYRRHEPS